MIIRVILTPDEIKKCEYIAKNWDIMTGKRKINWGEMYGRGNIGVYDDVLNGVKSEMVVAKAFGLNYDGDIGIPGLYDVGGKYEVRCTKYRNGCLILHPEDKEANYILVTGEGNEFEIKGWIFSKDGKKQEYWRTNIRFPCFFVPQDKLNDIQELLKNDT